MSKFPALIKPVSRFVLTAFLLLITAYLLMALWNAYVRAPWTRDGRVSAQIVRIAPEVSGTVRGMAVTDNQRVHKGDVLYRLDPARFQLALEQAQSELAAATAILNQRAAEAKRRRGMESLLPAEEIQQAQHADAFQMFEQPCVIGLDNIRSDKSRCIFGDDATTNIALIGKVPDRTRAAMVQSIRARLSRTVQVRRGRERLLPHHRGVLRS